MEQAEYFLRDDGALDGPQWERLLSAKSVGYNQEARLQKLPTALGADRARITASRSCWRLAGLQAGRTATAAHPDESRALHQARG